MSMRTGNVGGMMRLDHREALEDSLAALNQTADENLSDDDYPAEMQPDVEEAVEKEDPLLLAIDDLEGRVVTALDDVRLHPGVRSSSAPGSPTVHEELATLLRPVLEVAAHTGPSVARTYYSGFGVEGIEASCEDVYARVVSDLVLPVMLEMAQSDTNAPRRGASLEFFRHLWAEYHKAGSWLDSTTTGPQMGPFGAGGKAHSMAPNTTNPLLMAQQKRRMAKRLAWEGEILRYWIQASISCTTPGVFTSDASETATASRGIIAASASLRPSLRHIAQRIKDADDRGATKVFNPVMKMIEGVLKKMFLNVNDESSSSGDAIRSACIKFLEIVVICCSRNPKDSSSRRRGNTSSQDFSLDDLPEGHPVITREALESLAEFAFAILRGLTMMGGQVKIDVNLLSDMMLTSGGNDSPSAQVVSILKPAALAYLEIESSFPVGEDVSTLLDFKIDRSTIEFDFTMSQKSYSLTLNAMSALAMSRPMFFKEAAVCLARRAVNPPVFVEGGPLPRSATLAVASHLKAACLTLLRNALSIAANAWETLHQALKRNDMEIQADKALSMARQATALKTAGRAARNRANMYYEWDSSAGDQRLSKRHRETDDALAKMRAAKAARGLGHGIQLPTNMADAVELVIANLHNIPSKRPQTPVSPKARPFSISLDFVVDAIMTNGASLAQEDGRWYDRDGGGAFKIDLEAEQKYELSSKFASEVLQITTESKKRKPEIDSSQDQKRLFVDQCNSAASDAVGRIVAQTTNHRSAFVNSFGNKLASRLAWTLKGVKAPMNLQQSHTMAKDSIESASKRLKSEEEKGALAKFVDDYPIVSACLTLESTTGLDMSGSQKASTVEKEEENVLSLWLLNEAYVQSLSDGNHAPHDLSQYERSVDVFVSSAVHASERSNDKPNEAERKKAATRSATSLQRGAAILPYLSASSIEMICGMCDIDAITKKATEAGRKTSQQTIAVSAAVHAAKAAAEKRAVAALLILRDAAFQRSNQDTRQAAVSCAVQLAAGRLPASASIEDKALKLVMNVLFSKSDALAEAVVESAQEELSRAADYAIEKYDDIQKANSETGEKEKLQNPLAPCSDLERQVLEKVKKAAVLIMALCVRRPNIIKVLMEISSRKRADALSKAVRANMSRLARAAAAKHGAAAIALQVAAMSNNVEIPLVLAFLDNLAPSTDKNQPSDEIIEACHQIQETKLDANGKKDPRFIIPVVSAMKRVDLTNKLTEFVVADDKIFLAALVRMGDRVARQALLYRDEPDPENPSLKGMTLCEQLVLLHKLDFAKSGLTLKRYLDVIRLCLESEDIFSDRVVMSALDHISGTFLTSSEGLPLAYMRTIIMVCTKHESLHSWICHILLPRLVEGKIYTDKKQWEGWMRCAKMLENTGDPAVSSREAIEKLPAEQYEMYRKRHK